MLGSQGDSDCRGRTSGWATAVQVSARFESGGAVRCVRTLAMPIGDAESAIVLRRVCLRCGEGVWCGVLAEAPRHLGSGTRAA
jgi:hypothetical protein